MAGSFAAAGRYFAGVAGLAAEVAAGIGPWRVADRDAGFSLIESSSISKIRVALGPMSEPFGGRGP